TKKPLTVRMTGDTVFKKIAMPRPAEGHATTPITNASQLIENLPDGSLDDLQTGRALVVISTRGATPDRVTAITILSNADGLIKAAIQEAGPNGNAMESLSKLHGGMFSGPGGLSMPAMIQ